MPWPVVRLPVAAPPAQIAWHRQDDARVLGPHTVVAVFAGTPPAPPVRPPQVVPALRQRIEYARLFEDGHSPPAPPTGSRARRAVERYAQALPGGARGERQEVL